MSTGILLKEELTTAAVFGGTSHEFVPDGTQIDSGIHLIDITEPDFVKRFQMVMKHRPPVFNSKTGTFSKGKYTVSLSRPYSHEVNGMLVGVSFPVMRVEIEATPDAMGDAALLRLMGGQILLSTAMDGFFNRGSLVPPTVG